MAGPAPTDSQFTGTLTAGPAHCSVWLVAPAEPPDPTEVRFGEDVVLWIAGEVLQRKIVVER